MPGNFDYQRYLASREWSLLREQVRDRSGNRCEFCFSAPQQAVHHLTYERIGHEDLADLLAVCNPCHEYLSGKSPDWTGKDLGIVSPAMTCKLFQGQLRHYFIPYAFEYSHDETGRLVSLPVCHQVKEVACRGANCIWCPHADENYLVLLGNLWTSTQTPPRQKSRQKSIVSTFTR